MVRDGNVLGFRIGWDGVGFRMIRRASGMGCGMEGGGGFSEVEIVCDGLTDDRMGWIIPKNLRFQFFEARVHF